MSNQGYAVKIQFESTTKIYEYFLPADVEIPFSLEDVRAVVDARGEPKIVKVVGIVGYEDRFYDGDLKPIIAMFSGGLIYVKPDEPREVYRPTPTHTLASSNIDDDDIPF